MGFRLVPKSVTLKTLNGEMPVILRFSPNSLALGADYVKVVENRVIHLQRQCSPKNLVFSDISLMAIFAEVTENECIQCKGLVIYYHTSETEKIIFCYDHSGVNLCASLQGDSL